MQLVVPLENESFRSVLWGVYESVVFYFYSLECFPKCTLTGLLTDFSDLDEDVGDAFLLM